MPGSSWAHLTRVRHWARPRWRRLVALSALGALLLGFAAWRTAIWWLERTPLFRGAYGPACAETLHPSYATAANEARPHAQALLSELRIPGLAVAIAVDGRVVWSEGFGYADREAGLRACPSMRFRAQSVSKPLTTAAMARLHERGVIDLDAPVSRYLPALRGAIARVTPRQLASHRAGVRHYRDDRESLNTTHYTTATASLEKFIGDSLLFAPGSDFHYSSYGFVLLSAALEGAANADLPTILRREVAEPLGLAGTGAELGDEAVPERVTFYDHVTPYSEDGRVVRSPRLDMSSKWAGGGLLTTAPDLVRFASALISPTRGYLGPETVELLFDPVKPRLPGFGYALGWMAARDPRLRRVRFHFGAGSGGTAVLAVYPDQRVAVAVLANLGHAGFTPGRLFGIVNAFVSDPLWRALGLDRRHSRTNAQDSLARWR